MLQKGRSWASSLHESRGALVRNVAPLVFPPGEQLLVVSFMQLMQAISVLFYEVHNGINKELFFPEKSVLSD